MEDSKRLMWDIKRNTMNDININLYENKVQGDRGTSVVNSDKTGVVLSEGYYPGL